jgi:hypothetical protein
LGATGSPGTCSQALDEVAFDGGFGLEVVEKAPERASN